MGDALPGLHWLWKRSAATAGWIWGLVMSHWVLDFVTHRPDMPLVPSGGPKLGLGLWNSVVATLVVEGAMFAVAVGLYVSGTRAKDAAGKYGLAGLVLLLSVAYVGNTLGPPPPSPRAIALVALLGAVLFLLWASWVDRHRPARS